MAKRVKKVKKGCRKTCKVGANGVSYKMIRKGGRCVPRRCGK